MSLETICSMEHEYGIYTFRPEMQQHLADSFIDSLPPDLILFENPNGRIFLKNGMLVYRDLSLLEIALPECSSPYEVVCYDLAANRLIADLSKKLGFNVFKNNIEKLKRSFGCHENYFYKLSDKALENTAAVLKNYDFIFSRIVPFLLTRYVLAGSGNFCDGEFTLSQRASVLLNIRTESCGFQTYVLFHKKDERLCSDGLRIHITSGDSNMSEFTNYLKIGITSLVLKMIESGFIFSNFNVLNTMEALDEINKDISCSKVTINYTSFKVPFFKLFERSGCVSALEVQKMYLNAAKKFVAHYGIDKDIVDKWEFVLRALKENPKSLGKKIDWIIKKSLIDLVNDKSSGEEINLQYHCLSHEGFFSRIKRSLKLEKIANDSDVEKAIYEPPRTRALTRKQVAEKLMQKNAKIKRMEWNFIEYTSDGNEYMISLDTPFYIPIEHYIPRYPVLE